MPGTRFVSCRMWTTENRSRYCRDKLRYPSDLTDAQWLLLEPFLPPAAENCRPRKTDLREVVNALFSLNRAGCPWRMVPRDFPPWGTVYHSFEGGRVNGTWARIGKTTAPYQMT